MKKSAILSVLIAVLVLILGATGCDNSGQQSLQYATTTTPTPMLTPVTTVGPSTPNTNSPNTYTLVTSDMGILHLKLLKEWSGTGNKEFFFDVSPGPVVLDWSSSQTSQLGASFTMYGGKVNVADARGYDVDFYAVVVGQTGYTVANKSGHFIVKIESSGCEWTVRVGTE